MSYCHCTLAERGMLEVLVQQGKNCTQIAQQLGRHRTTIGRELRRNRTRAGYDAQHAQGRYTQRRKACRPRGRLAHEPLREYVADKIAVQGWSPELVAGRVRTDFPDDARMRVCHESVYQAIYANRHYLDFLQEYLPQARPKRRKRGQGKTRRASLIPNRVSIDQRPAAVDERVEPGHWEGDLVVGKGQDGFILTLVERTSRLLHAVKTQTRRAHEVAHATIQALLDRPISWVKTLTFDNGSEFAGHQTMAAHLGVDVYFADPYSAYQRGSNEQVNGLIRRYLPKRTPFSTLTQEHLDRIVDRINNRPRKCLGYRTPNEVFQLQRQLHFRALRT